jgi:beta-N-acetylhexosaminidase
MISLSKGKSLITNAVLILSLLGSFLIPPVDNPKVQASSAFASANQQAVELLEQLSPEERVGQLFIITFQGADVSSESQIYDLINNHHVGGVVLKAENDNFILEEGQPNEEILSQVYNLTTALQQNVWSFSRQSQLDPDTGEDFFPSYIPPLIAISQEGDGYPYDQILYGMTPLPNAMTLGATWTPELAAQIGSILGSELSLLGINMLLGPSLDVLEPTHQELSNSLGTRAFGSDPYWVAQAGRAYIRGIHEGSNGKVAVVAKHFPGHGSSDRLPEEEVSTVRKSLDELQSFDLAPFFAVTGNAIDEQEIAEALLVSNIRYQGLQGNIRATTRPVSFDPQAFSLLMELPELAEWRSQGGIMISDDLGSQAVRGFYELSGQDYDPRRVTLNAFLAGNDLLYVADFSTNDPEAENEEEQEPNDYEETIRTLEFFAQKYREDAAFAQRVDESVTRILTRKYHLYPNFTLGIVMGNQENLEQIGVSSDTTFEVARQSATLISPTQAELDEGIPDPPNQTERVVFITDSRSAQQCIQCQSTPILEVNAVQDAVLRLYGPQAGGQITSYNLSSFSLSDLEEMLISEPLTTQLERDLRRANWIVFNMLDEQENLPSYDTLKTFLSERPDLLQQKKLFVFSLSAPYYLDATTISKLTAYYALYSKSEPFIDVLAYLLFKELRPSGASPVSIPGVGYDLNEALFPDPTQTIPLELDLPEIEAAGDENNTPEPPPPPEFRVGDVIPLRTGLILDHNGNQVPDGTPVNFVFTSGAEANAVTQVAFTFEGLARTTYLINDSGGLEIYAESENARSENLKLDIPLPNAVTETVTPTEKPTNTATLEPTATTPVPLATPTPAPEPTPQTAFFDWVMALLISAGISFLSYRLALLIGEPRWAVRAGLLAFIGGLLAYTYLALQMPGADQFLEISVSLSVFLGTLVGAVIGMLATLSWRIFTPKNHITSNGRHITGK